MNITSISRPAVAAVMAFGILPLSVHAVPGLNSAYMTDAQHVFVQDATSDGISNLNMVLCIMDAMKPAAMVNQGDYVALVDKGKCDNKGQSSASNSTAGSSGATAAPDYMTAVVNVTRVSNNDPMVARIWMSLTEEGHTADIYVRLTATVSPGDAPPYGTFRLDYIGKASGTTMFNGFIDANGANVSYLETGNNSSDNKLTLIADSATSGSGTMAAMDFTLNPPVPVSFDFAYDASETNFPSGVFRRNDGVHDVCFDRSKAHAHKSVWRYGTYNGNDGTRVDQAYPGFPVQGSYNGSHYFGFASYWGVHFQGLDLNSLGDGTVAGLVITDQRPGTTETYSLAKNSGKLTKWTHNATTLTALDGIPFSFWGDISGITTGNGSVTGPGNWQMQWDDAQQHFIVIGQQNCSSSGCVLNTISPIATVDANAFDVLPIMGWADALGGNITIPPTSAPHASADAVNYYTQSDVIPGSAAAPTALHCLNNCPTAAAIAAFVSNSGSTPPFGNGTATQWITAPSLANTVDYSFGSTGLTESTAGLAVTDSTLFTGMYQNGIMSGRMYDVALSTTGCPNGAAVCEPSNPTSYYTWQTGARQWNQSMWLIKDSDSSVVSFDPPEGIAYTVPNDSATYGSWANKALRLQFNGFGNLHGIPGSCVNPTDNSPVDCGTAGARYVPAFALADGTTMTLTSSNTPLIVKALDAELRLAEIPSCSGATLTLPSSSLTLPSLSDVHDPSSLSDAYYIGTKPTVTAAPKVIHGAIQ
ncbi:MAG: hypothetical protein HY940_06560 [Gammaproteobacteria bacterium]|nr:hypothetical protein [Gammaproteobacteria bacterium]